jgi:hypothetical protein
MPPLSREERHSLLIRDEEYASSISRRGTLSPLQRGGVCLLSIKKRDTLSSSEKRSMPPLYREEGHSLLFREEAYASSL